MGHVVKQHKVLLCDCSGNNQFALQLHTRLHLTLKPSSVRENLSIVVLAYNTTASRLFQFLGKFYSAVITFSKTLLDKSIAPVIVSHDGSSWVILSK